MSATTTQRRVAPAGGRQQRARQQRARQQRVPQERARQQRAAQHTEYAGGHYVGGKYAGGQYAGGRQRAGQRQRARLQRGQSQGAGLQRGQSQGARLQRGQSQGARQQRGLQRAPALRLLTPIRPGLQAARLRRAAEFRRAPRGRTVTRKQAELRAAKASRDFGMLVAVTGILCLVGLVMVLSASSIASLAQYGSVWGIFDRQAMWMAVGVAAFLIGMRVPYAFWRKIRIPFMLIGLALLVVVLVPGIGQLAGGSSRWIGAGEFRIQPSELMKLALAVYGADLVARREDPHGSAREQWRDLVFPMLFVLAIAAVLIYKQPDLGTATVVCCIAFAQLHAGGVRLRLLGGTVAAVVAIGATAILTSPYQRARLNSFMNPFAHAGGSGYQLVQSLVALGSGRVTGTGAGTSVVKWGFLPNAHTDFIFAVIGNELGLLGALLVTVLFALFGWYGVRTASRAPDRFASLLAVGITCWVVVQAAINIGGVIGLLPITGIPLPFVSFGGSSLVVVMLAAGILVGISRTTERRARAMASRR